MGIRELKGWIWRNWFYLLAFLLFTIAVLGLWKNSSIPPPKDDRISWKVEVDSTTYLQRNDSTRIDAGINRERIAHLLEIGSHVNSILYETTISRESTRMQMRGFYITILSVLVAGIFLPRAYRDTHPQIGRLIGAAVFAAGFLYMMDIHVNDVNKRDLRFLSRNGEAMHSMLSIRPDDSSFYTLDYTRDTLKYSQKGSLSEPQKRKIDAFFAPTLEQVIFYFVPPILLLLLRKKLDKY